MPSEKPSRLTAGIALPALRGSFGDWTYYSAVMQLSALAERVSFADEIHTNKALSQLIQRSLKGGKKGGRSFDIANYLANQEERFFNSLVIAVYGGSPEWVGLKLPAADSSGPDLGPSEDCLGVLHFNGSEKLFAVDGQHRLAGMKRLAHDAVTSGTPASALSDLASVLFIAHRTDKIERTRRLFTTLNKTAVPVSKMERIALDENDVMAITVRRLVEREAAFAAPRIAMHHTNNLGSDDAVALTTIGNLYDVLRLVFLARSNWKKKDLEYNRPADEKLDEFFKLAKDYFSALTEIEPGLKAYFSATDPKVACANFRKKTGGSIYFRPIGLTMMTEVAMMLRKASPSDWKLKMAALPRRLDKTPFAGTIWSHRNTIEPKHRVLCRNLLMYMCGHSIVPADELRAKLSDVMGVASPLPKKVTVSKAAPAKKTARLRSIRG